MLHYMGYPDRLRTLVMQHDAQRIAHRHAGTPDAATPPNG